MVDEVDPGLNGEAHSLLQDPGGPQRSQTGLIDPLNSLYHKKRSCTRSFNSYFVVCA